MPDEVTHVTIEVHIDTPWGSRTDELEIPVEDLEGLDRDGREEVYAEYAQTVFFNQCNYGWTSPDTDQGDDRA